MSALQEDCELDERDSPISEKKRISYGKKACVKRRVDTKNARLQERVASRFV